MGFFNYMMNGMGFETTTTTEKKEKKIKKGAEPEKDRFAKYSFAQTEDASSGTFSAGDIQNQGGVSSNVIVYSPSNQEEINNLVDFLRRKEPIIVNFADLTDDALVAYVFGALYALKGSIHPISKDLFLITPDGVNILLPTKQN